MATIDLSSLTPAVDDILYTETPEGIMDEIIRNSGANRVANWYTDRLKKEGVPFQGGQAALDSPIDNYFNDDDYNSYIQIIKQAYNGDSDAINFITGLRKKYAEQAAARARKK